MNKIRLGWKSSMLQSISARTIVGFDLRRGGSLSSLFMTSYDKSARYEDINESFFCQLSGLNLFNTDPTSNETISIPSDARVIAFDLPSEFVAYLSNFNVSSPQSLSLDAFGEGWKFMGFDVVDSITQTSAFHGFDLPEIEIKKISEKYAFVFNDNNLIDKAGTALDVSYFFNNKIPEHYPFIPCGIWLKGK